MSIATSIIDIGCNIGNFLASFGLRAFQSLSGSTSIFVSFRVIDICL